MLKKWRFKRRRTQTRIEHLETLVQWLNEDVESVCRRLRRVEDDTLGIISEITSLEVGLNSIAGDVEELEDEVSGLYGESLLPEGAFEDEDIQELLLSRLVPYTIVDLDADELRALKQEAAEAGVDLEIEEVQ